MTTPKDFVVEDSPPTFIYMRHAALEQRIVRAKAIYSIKITGGCSLAELNPSERTRPTKPTPIVGWVKSPTSQKIHGGNENL